MRIALLSLSLVLLTLFAYAYFARATIVEKVLSKTLGVEVTLDDFHLGWNRLAFENLKIRYRENQEPLFQADHLGIEMAFRSLLKGEVEISNLDLDSPKFTIEATPVIAKALSKEKDRNKKFSLHHLKVHELSVNSLLLNSRIVLPDFEVDDVETKGMKTVFEEVVQRVKNEFQPSVLRQDSEKIKIQIEENKEVLKKRAEEVKGFLEELFKSKS